MNLPRFRLPTVGEYRLTGNDEAVDQGEMQTRN